MDENEPQRSQCQRSSRANNSLFTIGLSHAAEMLALIILILVAASLPAIFWVARLSTKLLVVWMLPLAVVVATLLPRMQRLVSFEKRKRLQRGIMACTVLAFTMLYAVDTIEIVEHEPPPSRPQPTATYPVVQQAQAPPARVQATPEPPANSQPPAIFPAPKAQQPFSVPAPASGWEADSSFLPLMDGLGTAPAADALSFVSPPRISRQQFSRVLQRGGARGPSPAAPLADELYQIVVDYGLDPAVALAFFAHESQFGKAGVTKSQDTKSWGNLRKPVDADRAVGYARTRYGRYVRYASWQDGLRDWCELILNRYVAHGLDTVDEAIPVYAPSSDHNAPDRFIWSVKRLVRTWRRADPNPH